MTRRLNRRCRETGLQSLAVFELLEARVVLDSAMAAGLLDPSGTSPKDGVPREQLPGATLRPFDRPEQLQRYLLDAAVKQWKDLFGQPTWTTVGGRWWPQSTALLCEAGR